MTMFQEHPQMPEPHAHMAVRHQVVRVRQEPKRRKLTVASVEHITPKMARISFTSPDLADFDSPAHDDHVKLFFTVETTVGVTETCMRDYTPRQFDPSRRYLVVDFALHETGPATRWAMHAKPGDTLEIGGPKGSKIVPDDFDWYLFIGDETALPAIGRRIEELRRGVPSTTMIVVDDEGEKQTFSTQADLREHWLSREAAGPDDAETILRAIEKLQTPEGDGFIWIAAEAEVVRTVRRHFLDVRRHPPAWGKASGYWVRGEPGKHQGFRDDAS